MKQLVHVEYSVPVSVVVDLGRGEIDDVLIHDWQMTQTPTVFNADRSERIVDRRQFRAQRIAREEDWPQEWQFSAIPRWLKKHWEERGTTAQQAPGVRSVKS